MAQHREYGPDNLRGILILLVVFGHLLERCAPFPGQVFLYRTIYAFHMPVFLFLSGYFARFDVKKILCGLLIPYILFQTAYLLFDNWLYGKAAPIQYTTPEWVLWYLMAVMFYHLLLPVYSVDSTRQRLLALGITFVLSLLAGYDRAVGYRLSLSRFLVFQPWFLLGYYSRQGNWIPKLTRWCRDRDYPVKMLLTGAITVLPLVMQLIGFPIQILYGAHAYEVLDYGPMERGFAAITALAWIGFGALVLLPLLRWRLPMLTALGQNTMSVFLLHGFAVRYIQHRQPLLLKTPWMVAIVTILILAVFGNPIVGNFFRNLFSGTLPQPRDHQE